MAAKTSNSFKILVFIFLLLNIVPIGGAGLKIWPIQAVAYIYWAECVLMAVLALIVFAKRLSVFFIILAAALAIVHFSVDQPIADLQSTLTFWGLYSLSWVIYIEMGYSAFGLLIKRLDRLEQFAIYMVYMISAIIICFALTATINDSWSVLKLWPAYVWYIFLGMAAIVPTLSITFLRIIDMIGHQHFLFFLLGTYLNPVERDRVVLFLDIVGSSTWAEQLQPKQSMKLISRFIFDATAIFRLHGGDVINYIGDGLVVLWPRRQADKALMAVTALRQRIEDNTAIYNEEFGIVPDFRIGMHAGKIVMSQIGEEKLFLGVYGDVVNTAARLEQMNKELKTKILLSDAFVHSLSQARKAYMQSLGKQAIRGREEPITVYTPRKAAATSAA